MRFVAMVERLGQIAQIELLAADAACVRRFERFRRGRKREIVFYRGGHIVAPFQAGARFVSQPLTPKKPWPAIGKASHRKAAESRSDVTFHEGT